MLIECDRSKFRAPAEIKRLNKECDRDLQCRVFLGSTPLSLSE